MEPNSHHQIGPNASRWPVREASSRPGLYEVECIAGCWIRYGVIDYLIKYKRYRTLEWTPSKNVRKCKDAIKRFRTAMGWKRMRKHGTWYLPDHLWDFDEEAIDSVNADDDRSEENIEKQFKVTTYIDSPPATAECQPESVVDANDLNTTTTTDKRAESVPNSTLMPATPLPIPMPQNLVDTAGEECDLSAAWDDSWDFPLYRLDDRNGPVEGQKRSTLSSCCIEAMQTMVAENHRLAATNQHLVAEIEKLTDKLAKIPTVQKQEEKKDFPTP